MARVVEKEPKIKKVKEGSKTVLIILMSLLSAAILALIIAVVVMTIQKNNSTTEEEKYDPTYEVAGTDILWSDLEAILAGNRTKYVNHSTLPTVYIFVYSPNYETYQTKDSDGNTVKAEGEDEALQASVKAALENYKSDDNISFYVLNVLSEDNLADESDCENVYSIEYSRGYVLVKVETKQTEDGHAKFEKFDRLVDVKDQLAKLAK